MKKILKVCLAVLLCMAMIAVLPSCQSSDDNDDDYSYDGEKYEAKTITKAEAIEKAQKSSKVQNAIANAWGLKQYYVPNWGVCSAEKSGDDWDVTLKGNISGYTDEYQKDFVYDKGFSVKVTVSSSGTVTYVGYVSKQY